MAIESYNDIMKICGEEMPIEESLFDEKISGLAKELNEYYDQLATVSNGQLMNNKISSMLDESQSFTEAQLEIMKEHTCRMASLGLDEDSYIDQRNKNVFEKIVENSLNPRVTEGLSESFPGQGILGLSSQTAIATLQPGVLSQKWDKMNYKDIIDTRPISAPVFKREIKHTYIVDGNNVSYPFAKVMNDRKLYSKILDTTRQKLNIDWVNKTQTMVNLKEQSTSFKEENLDKIDFDFGIEAVKIQVKVLDYTEEPMQEKTEIIEYELKNKQIVRLEYGDSVEKHSLPLEVTRKKITLPDGTEETRDEITKMAERTEDLTNISLKWDEKNAILDTMISNNNVTAYKLYGNLTSDSMTKFITSNDDRERRELRVSTKPMFYVERDTLTSIIKDSMVNYNTLATQINNLTEAGAQASNVEMVDVIDKAFVDRKKKDAISPNGDVAVIEERVTFKNPADVAYPSWSQMAREILTSYFNSIINKMLMYHRGYDGYIKIVANPDLVALYLSSDDNNIRIKNAKSSDKISLSRQNYTIRVDNNRYPFIIVSDVQTSREEGFKFIWCPADKNAPFGIARFHFTTFLSDEMSTRESANRTKSAGNSFAMFDMADTKEEGAVLGRLLVKNYSLADITSQGN